MALDPLTKDLRTFISRYIDSVAHLEVLLLLFKNPAREWTASEVNEELRSNLNFIRNRLARLEKMGLAKRGAGGTYIFCPKTGELADLVSQLAKCYVTYRLRLIDEIYSSHNAVRAFADAFKLGGKEGDQDDS